MSVFLPSVQPPLSPGTGSSGWPETTTPCETGPLRQCLGDQNPDKIHTHSELCLGHVHSTRVWVRNEPCLADAGATHAVSVGGRLAATLVFRRHLVHPTREIAGKLVQGDSQRRYTPTTELQRNHGASTPRDTVRSPSAQQRGHRCDSHL